jgi:hypothetical protein
MEMREREYAGSSKSVELMHADDNSPLTKYPGGSFQGTRCTSTQYPPSYLQGVAGGATCKTVFVFSLQIAKSFTSSNRLCVAPGTRTTCNITIHVSLNLDVCRHLIAKAVCGKGDLRSWDQLINFKQSTRFSW